MTAGKKFGLILTVSFIAALSFGIANKIIVGFWLWPNVLLDTALIIRSLTIAFALTVFLFGSLVVWPEDRKWLFLAIIGLVFSMGLGLVTRVWSV